MKYLLIAVLLTPHLALANPCSIELTQSSYKGVDGWGWVVSYEGEEYSSGFEYDVNEALDAAKQDCSN